jgi:hypothetical protein
MKEIVNFWKLNQEQKDKFESLVVLGILDFQDNETLNTVYFNKKNFKESKKSFTFNNGCKTLSGSYFYGNRDQYLYFLNNQF